MPYVGGTTCDPNNSGEPRTYTLQTRRREMAPHAGDTYFRIAQLFPCELIPLDPRMEIPNPVGNCGGRDV